jgi:hypothetical protein
MWSLDSAAERTSSMVLKSIEKNSILNTLMEEAKFTSGLGCLLQFTAGMSTVKENQSKEKVGKRMKVLNEIDRLFEIG